MVLCLGRWWTKLYGLIVIAASSDGQNKVDQADIEKILLYWNVTRCSRGSMEECNVVIKSSEAFD